MSLSIATAKKLRHAIETLLDEEISIAAVSMLMMTRVRYRHKGQLAQAAALGISVRSLQRKAGAIEKFDKMLEVAS